MPRRPSASRGIVVSGEIEPSKKEPLAPRGRPRSERWGSANRIPNGLDTQQSECHGLRHAGAPMEQVGSTGDRSGQVVPGSLRVALDLRQSCRALRRDCAPSGGEGGFLCGGPDPSIAPHRVQAEVNSVEARIPLRAITPSARERQSNRPQRASQHVDFASEST